MKVGDKVTVTVRGEKITGTVDTIRMNTPKQARVKPDDGSDPVWVPLGGK